jgi:hypothetical protein
VPPPRAQIDGVVQMSVGDSAALARHPWRQAVVIGRRGASARQEGG